MIDPKRVAQLKRYLGQEKANAPSPYSGAGDLLTYIADLEQLARDMTTSLTIYLGWGAMTQSDKYLHEQAFIKVVARATELGIEPTEEAK